MGLFSKIKNMFKGGNKPLEEETKKEELIEEKEEDLDEEIVEENNEDYG